MCGILPRACRELLVGDELTRSLSALTFSGSCSRSRGVSGISVRLDGVMDRCEKGKKGREKRWKQTQMIIYHLKPLTAFKKTKKTVVPH